MQKVRSIEVRYNIMVHGRYWYQSGRHSYWLKLVLKKCLQSVTYFNIGFHYYYDRTHIYIDNLISKSCRKNVSVRKTRENQDYHNKTSNLF